MARRRVAIVAALIVSPLCSGAGFCQAAPPNFAVLAIAEKGGLHQPFVDAAKVWLEREALAGGFAIDYIEDTNRIDEAFLAKYRVFLQLNYPPYRWEPTAMDAFRKYIEEGRGGWIGFHHATLLGEFDGYAMWQWFSMFMGSIRFATYIPTFATGTVKVEAPSHPVMQGVASSFSLENEEWYTYDKSPRANVRDAPTLLRMRLPAFDITRTPSRSSSPTGQFLAQFVALGHGRGNFVAFCKAPDRAQTLGSESLELISRDRPGFASSYAATPG